MKGILCVNALIAYRRSQDRLQSFRVGLILRHCLFEWLQRQAVVIDAPDGGKRIEVDLVAIGIGHLRHQYYVGESRRIAVAELPGVLLRRQALLERREANGDPVPVPGIFLFVGQFQRLGQVGQCKVSLSIALLCGFCLRCVQKRLTDRFR